jgi:anaerobic C4-dicarboxylate transporter
MAVIEILQGVTLLVGYCTLVLAIVLGITAMVVQSFALLDFLNIAILLGIRILQPKVVASAPAVTKLYAKSEASPIRQTVSFPKLYIAHTGYYVDNDPNKPILGVYAAEHIQVG